MKEVIKKTLENKSALLSYIKASPNKHISKIAESMGIETSLLKEYLVNYNLLDKVILINTPEKELSNILLGFVKSRTAIPPYEIDFYNENLKLGVEFNGNYWHSTEFKTQYYHQEKAQMAFSNGIKLYQIFEYEWNDKNLPIIISHIQRLAGCLKRIELEQIKEISKDVALDFLWKTTINFEDFDIALGGYTSELISVMTFKDNILTNYTESLSYAVSDGFKQMFSHFRNNYSSEEIKAFPDLGKYIWDYESCFLIKGCTEPELVWFKDDILTEDKKAFLLRGSKLSEENTLKKFGYKKLYTCGKIKMISFM